LKRTPSDIIDKVIYLIQGKIYPDYQGIELGLAGKMAIRALVQSTGLDMGVIKEAYRITGDLGDAAKEVMNQRIKPLFLKIR
jgi:DNA ligase 1